MIVNRKYNKSKTIPHFTIKYATEILTKCRPKNAAPNLALRRQEINLKGLKDSEMRDEQNTAPNP